MYTLTALMVVFAFDAGPTQIGKPVCRGKTADQWLVVLMNEADATLRLRAAIALRELAPKSSSAALLLGTRLRDQDEGVRQMAAEALGRIGADAAAAVPSLIAALKDSDSVVRAAAAESLGLIALVDEKLDAVPGLAAALKDEHLRIRSAAADALGRMMVRLFPQGPKEPPLPDLPPALIAELAGSIPDLAAAGSDERRRALRVLLRQILYRIDPAQFLGGAPKVVFVADRSGSMDCILDFLLRDISKAVNRLDSYQHFDLIWFSDGETHVRDVNLVAATEDHKTRLMKDLADIRCRGDTDPRDAMQRAFDARPDRIILFTDGEFESGFVEEITKANHAGHEPVRITAIGFKTRKSQTMANLVELTKRNGGSLRIVDLTSLSE